MTDQQDTFPTTVETAVRLLQGLVPDAEQATICALAEGDLINLHHGLGQWIRNHLGLWGYNPKLLTATGEQTADDASDVIIRAFWVALRGKLPQIH
jgi:hypothetical protein